jgi:carbon monoxide dehydrogenase subunit G
MEFMGEHSFRATPADIRRALRDERILLACVPRLNTLDRRGVDEYRAVFVLRLGPLPVRVPGIVRFLPDGGDGAVRVEGRGDGPFGFVRAEVELRLVDQDDGTRAAYRLTARIDGPLAALARAKLERHVRGFLERFGAMVDEMATA